MFLFYFHWFHVFGFSEDVEINMVASACFSDCFLDTYYVCDIGKYSKTPTFQFVTHQCNFRYVQISGFLFVMFLFYFSGDMNS